MADVEIANSLRELALGDIGAQEAKSLLAELVNHSPEVAARKVYPALQEVAWRFVRARSAPDDADDWIAVYRFCERLLDKHEQTHAARQVEVLGDLVVRTARYADLQPAEAVLTRRHVVPLLERLHSAGGKLPRKDLKRHLAVEEANLSRLIALLEASGLVARRLAGREAVIELTPEGRRSMPDPSPAKDVFHTLGPQLKSAAGIAVSMLDESGEWATTPNFEDCVGLPAQAAAALLREPVEDAWCDVQTAEHRWSRCISLPEQVGLKSLLWIDISDLKAIEDRASETIGRLEAELAQVKASKEAILAKQAREKAFESALRRRMVARLSGVKRYAVLSKDRKSAQQHKSNLLHELNEIQDIVVDKPPFSGSKHTSEHVNARVVFDEMVKLASFFDESGLKASAQELPGMDILPDPVLDTFRSYTAHGVRFRELGLFCKDGAVVFKGVTVGKYDDFGLGKFSTSYDVNNAAGFHVQTTNAGGSCLIEMVTPITAGPMRKMA